MTAAAYRSEILYLSADPRKAGAEEAVHHFQDGLMIVEGGHVAQIGAYEVLVQKLPNDVAVTAYDNALITPGFIDTHIHFPQTDIIAAYGAQLMDWLQSYTFPAEAAFADPTHARAAAKFFVEELLRNGTTSALVFATVHATSVDALFEAALEKNLRLISGKVLMDRNAPENLRDGADHGFAESAALLKRWRGRGRLGYAITPRFAPTSTREQLEMAGVFMRDNPDLLLQTHLSENKAEINFTRELFPEAKDYLDVYDRYGLLTDRSVFAHALHLPDGAFRRLAEADASIAFCPTSNLFLGSGLFDLARAERAGVHVALGTDVGAGTSFSMLQTLKAAYKVGQLGDYSLDPFTSFYLATLAGAEALGLSGKIGHLAPGAEADFLVLDLAATPLISRRMNAAQSLSEKLFVLSVLGDDRAVARAYAAGALVHDRDAPPAVTPALRSAE
ncbi:MAG: guanine deaminase [Parvularculaceae bacterium]